MKLPHGGNIPCLFPPLWAGVLRVDHPDIEAFIHAKRMAGRLANFNLSVGITDLFLKALDSGKPFALRNPRTGRTARVVDPAALFNAIVESAWTGGDPGILFLDEINRRNVAPALGMIEATNPCGEQPLLPYESCTLGSINLAAFVSEKDVDWRRLEAVIYDAVVFLDNVIEASSPPFPEIETATRRTRKMGLGVMGLAELLARIGIPYDSEEGLALADRIAGFLAARARAASAFLGERRGSFPAFSQSVWPSRGFTALRNATVTCVAPTGTISMIAGTSSGIEPFFALALTRRLSEGRLFVEMNPVLAALLESLGPLGSAAMKVVREQGSLGHMVELPEEVRRSFPVALEIAPEFHVRMQAAFQAHVDAGVSKTVNLPKNAPVETVRDVFLLARRLGLKGITVYRYDSRAGQTLSLGDEESRYDCRECAA